MSTPNIAVTYNEDVRGPVTSLIEVIKTLDTNLVICDYRKIRPPEEGLDQIHWDKKKKHAVFDEATIKAAAFLKENSIDCLIVSGNPAQVDTRLYGKPLTNEKIDLPRAIAEMCLIDVALEIGLPVLGICGGLQIFNTYLEGTIKDLEEADLRKQGYDTYETINVEADSTLAKIMNPKANQQRKEQPAKVFSSHTQVIDELGGKGRINNKEDYLKVVARSNDTHHNIEGCESQYGAPVELTQFHPEVAVAGLDNPKLPANMNRSIYIAQRPQDRLQNKRIIEAFVQAAVTFKNKRQVNEEVLEWAVKKKLMQECIERRLNLLKNKVTLEDCPRKTRWQHFFTKTATNLAQEQDNKVTNPNLKI